MLLALGAASSAINALKALTSTKPTTGVKQDTPNLFAFSADASASTETASNPGGGKTSAISPETMNALLAAQSQSGTDASASMRAHSLKDWFAKVDSDADGKISKSEFEALGAGDGARGDNAFSKLDTDGDGSISPAELLAALKGKGKHRDQQSDPLLQARQGASNPPAADADGSVTASAGASATAASSYNFIEQLTLRQSAMISAQASSSLSVSV